MIRSQSEAQGARREVPSNFDPAPGQSCLSSPRIRRNHVSKLRFPIATLAMIAVAGVGLLAFDNESEAAVVEIRQVGFTYPEEGYSG